LTSDAEFFHNLGRDLFGFVFLKDTLVLDSPLIRFSVLGEAASSVMASSLPSSLALDQVLIVETPIFAGEEAASSVMASSLPSSLALDQVLIVETPIFAGEETAVLLVVLTVASEGFEA
jgi:hypothetical protein